MTSDGLMYNTHLPDEFTAKVCIPKDWSKEIGKSFIYGIGNETQRILGPTRDCHSCFGQMDGEIKVDSSIKEGDITIVYVKGMNGRYDRWMKAVFAVKRKLDGEDEKTNHEIWNVKLLIFERGGMYPGASLRSQWGRFDCVGFKPTDFKESVLHYDSMTVQENKNEVVIKKQLKVLF